ARPAHGGIDVIIGTHRIVSPDVKFKDLGLVIIDEEQRFGVEHKERLKALRRTVDVLTLTATPIPRTLHLSLLGIRDISNLEIPPQDRLAIETRIARFDPALVRNAIIRELNRDGQVYFVHNRVHSIRAIADRLQEIVPEARILIGHGQMSEHELERTMLDFVQHRAAILGATTILGAGNILEAEQSGHIAAIGYELYCQLLGNAVRTLKRQPLKSWLDVTVELPWRCYLPRDYVPGLRQKIEVYRKLARLRQLDD